MSTKLTEGIYQTEDYSMFKFGNNRPINRSNVESKKVSIKEFGLLIPIEVTSDFVIKEGQHRFIALKELGMPVIYRFSLSDTFSTVEIAEMNSSVHKWDMFSFISVIANSGNDSYQRILNLWNEFPDVGWVVLSLAISTSSKSSDVKSGKIKLTGTEYNTARDILTKATSIYSPIRESKYAGKIYLRAIVNLLKFGLYTYEELYEAFDKKARLLWEDYDRPSTMLAAVVRIESMYNYRLPAEQKKFVESDYKRIANQQGVVAHK